MKNNLAKNILIGVLVATLLVLNVIVPLIQKQQTKSLAGRAHDLLSQYKATSDTAQQKQLVNQMLGLRQRSAASTASADWWSGTGSGGGTTGGCDALIRASDYHWDQGNYAVSMEYFDLAVECIYGTRFYNQ